LRELNDLARNGKDLARLLSDLLSYFRNLMVFQFSKGDLSLMDVSEQESATLATDAVAIASDAVTRVMEVLADAEGRLREAASKKIFLEITLLKAIEARNAQSIDAVLKKLQQLRAEPVVNPGPQTAMPKAGAFSQNQVASVKRADPSTYVAVETTPAAERIAPTAETAGSHVAETPSAPPASSSAPTGVDMEAVWSQLVEAVGRVSPFVKTYLLESHPVALTKTSFTIGFDPEFKDHLGLVDNQKNRAILETKLHEMGYHDISARFVQAEAPPGRVRHPSTAAAAQPKPPIAATAPTPKPAAAHPSAGPALSKEDFKNDPLIKKALEIFKGTIVEVRG
jgi:DNA polymerase-3 subunit gamma/tau